MSAYDPHPLGLPKNFDFREEPIGKPPEATGGAPFHDLPRQPKDIAPATALHAISDGIRLRCPACGNPSMFRSFFTMRPFCPECGVVYEREQGSYVGAMYLNLILTEFFFIIGFVLLEVVFHASTLTELLILVPFNGLFPVWFYPRSRGVWAGILYLCGDLYRDPYKAPGSK